MVVRASGGGVAPAVTDHAVISGPAEHAVGRGAAAAPCSARLSPTRESFPARPNSRSWPVAPFTAPVAPKWSPIRLSSPSPPSTESAPGPPIRRSSPPRPQIRSLPPRPSMTSAPAVPMITSGPGVPLVPVVVAGRPKQVGTRAAACASPLRSGRSPRGRRHCRTGRPDVPVSSEGFPARMLHGGRRDHLTRDPFHGASPERPGRVRFHPFSGVAHRGCTAYRSDMLTGTALLGQYDKRMNVIIGG